MINTIANTLSVTLKEGHRSLIKRDSLLVTIPSVEEVKNPVYIMGTDYFTFTSYNKRDIHFPEIIAPNTVWLDNIIRLQWLIIFPLMM